MEQNIHTFLFAAGHSLKEHRLAHMSPATPDVFKGQVESVEKKIEAGDDVEAKKELALLQVEHMLDASKKPTLDTLVTKLNKLLDDKKKPEAIAQEAKELEDWMTKSKDSSDYDSAMEDARQFLEKQMAAIQDLVTGTDHPHNAAAQLDALVQSVEKIKAMDPELSGAKLDADKKPDATDAEVIKANDDLKNIQDDHKKFTETTGDFSRKLVAMEAAVKDGSKRAIDLAKADLDSLVTDRKNSLNGLIILATTGKPPYNAEKQIAELVKQIKEIDADVKSAKGEKVTAAPSVASSILGSAITGIKDMLIAAPAIAKDVTKRGIDALKVIPATLTDMQKQSVVDAINKELAANGSKKQVEIDKDGKLFLKEVKEGDKSVDPAKEVKTTLDQLVDLLKKLFEFLRGERIANGDVGALRMEIDSIDAKIAKLKKDNPDLDKKPEVKKEITELEIRKQELQLKLEQGRKLGEQVKNEVNSTAARSKLLVSANVDRNGNFYMIPNGNTPQALGHMRYMTAQIAKKHPQISVNQQPRLGQRVYINVHGDVNINSKNDNRRTINNTNTVIGSGNTVSASADGSQNGANTSRGGFAPRSSVDSDVKSRINTETGKGKADTEAGTKKPISKPKLRVDTNLPPTGDL